MSQEATFRIAFIAGFAAVLAIGLYHRMRSWASREPLDRWQEGAVLLFSLRIAGLILWLSVFAYMIDPAWMTWAAMPLPSWARWSGVALLIVTLVLLSWTLRSLGTNLTDTVVTRRDHTLITHGPYRWVRHPFYGCMALVIVAIALLAADWFFLAAGVVVFALLGVRTRIEEKHLVARFGDAYRTYMRRTGRFIPRWTTD